MKIHLLKSLKWVTSVFTVGCISSTFMFSSAFADSSPLQGPVSIQQGEMQWPDGTPVALFGVNYGLPFAYGYRAINKLGIEHKTAIDMDVDHIARLKVDAWRVHVWDRLISDKQGNLLDNEHLALFDYLVMKLQQKGIKAIVTPIAWWGSGYPEPDPVEPGFAVDYSKEQMNQDADVIEAQKTYLTQLLRHKNRYTGRTLAEDPEVIAFELFNEPKHTTAAQKSAEYVEQLLSTVRNLGITKPLFYNISEQGNDQDFAHALCQSSVDGIAFQWYPTGLVKNSTLDSNMLPAVSHYTNPFSDIEACTTKAKMVYEFDAADITKSVMYPAMARSFRDAGFQWATQFAYDPADLAHTNSEYNTHYLNLLYTPSKAISFMIAGEAFRQLPQDYKAPDYPASNNFGHTHLDFEKDLSQFDDGTQYYYSNTTNIAPKNSKTLTQIAGVGNSPLVHYQGTGAYFIDKQADGVWRLEVFPDVLALQDPHQPSSLNREVARLYVNSQPMAITLKELGNRFYIKGLSAQISDVQAQAQNTHFEIKPGVYLLARNQKQLAQAQQKQQDKDFYLPKLQKPEGQLTHQPQRQSNLGDALSFSARINGFTPSHHSGMYDVTLNIRYQGHRKFSAIPMQHVDGDLYQAHLPAADDWHEPGVLEYAISVNDGKHTVSFPGNTKGSPQDWDFLGNELGKSVGLWHTLLTPAGTPINLLNPLSDREAYFTPKNAAAWPATSATEEGATLKLVLFSDNFAAGGSLLRTTLTKDNQLKGRDLSHYNGLAIRIRSTGSNDRLQLGLIANDGLAWGTDFPLKAEWQTLVIPIDQLKPIRTLLAQAYPSFMPTTMGPFPVQKKMDLNAISGIQLILPQQLDKRLRHQRGVEIVEIALIQY